MRRLGVDLGALDAPPADISILDQCPGARVYVTRDEMAALVKGGETFRSDGTHVPAGGYGHARVLCTQPIATSHSPGVAGSLVRYGLCSSCHGLEQDNRAELRARQQRAGR